MKEIEQTDKNRLSLSSVTAIINAPIGKVDIGAWLLNLPEEEYQRCSTQHIAAGVTSTYDGKPMSINVETIGSALMVQHYVAVVHRPDYCRMLSVSDAITPNGRTKVQVLWELRVLKIDDFTCEFSNTIQATATPEFFEYLAENEITVEQAHATRQAASFAHNKEETPLFARSIEKKALTGTYGI
jgi:hypothetical protein